MKRIAFFACALLLSLAVFSCGSTSSVPEEPESKTAAASPDAGEPSEVSEETVRFFAAAALNSRQEIEALIASGADVNARGKNGWTALMIAAQYGAADAAEALIAAGADVNALNSFGSSAVFIAQNYARTEVEQLLLDAGAQPEYTGD